MSDGTNSRIYYTENSLAGDRAWVEGASFPEIYTDLKTTSAPGSVLAYSPSNAATGTINLTYTYGTGPASAHTGDTISLVSATLSPGSDFATQQLGVAFDQCVQITVLSATGFAEWHCKAAGICGPNEPWFYLDCAAVQHDSPAYPTSSTPIDIPAHTCVSHIGASGGDVDTGGTGAHYTLQVKIEALCNPGGNAVVRASTDYGATVGSAVTVGASPGNIGGFGVQYIGSVSYAAYAAGVKKATTLGGAYSAHTAYTGANPVCIVLPWGRWGSSTTDNLSVSDPDYIVALDQADSGGGALYKVNGTTAAKTDITPVAGATFNSANCITTWLGTYIRVICVVSGTPHLYVSSNSGSTWTDRGALSGATFIRGRKKQRSSADVTAKNMLFITGGTTLKTSITSGQNLYDRTKPSGSGEGIDILG